MIESIDITRLLEAGRAGDRHAMDRVFDLIYRDLHEMAHRQLSARPHDRTLNTTALVHETYLKLVHRSPVSPEDRNHLLALAARAMRQIVVDYARRSRAARRGGGAPRLSLKEDDLPFDPDGRWLDDRAAEILAVDDALARLQALDPRLSRVVELRFFAGFPTEEAGEILGVSARTVKRLWRTARALLYQSLRAG